MLHYSRMASATAPQPQGATAPPGRCDVVPGGAAALATTLATTLAPGQAAATAAGAPGWLAFGPCGGPPRLAIGLACAALPAAAPVEEQAPLEEGFCRDLGQRLKALSPVPVHGPAEAPPPIAAPVAAPPLADLPAHGPTDSRAPAPPHPPSGALTDVPSPADPANAPDAVDQGPSHAHSARHDPAAAPGLPPAGQPVSARGPRLHLVEMGWPPHERLLDALWPMIVPALQGAEGPEVLALYRLAGQQRLVMLVALTEAAALTTLVARPCLEGGAVLRVLSLCHCRLAAAGAAA